LCLNTFSRVSFFQQHAHNQNWIHVQNSVVSKILNTEICILPIIASRKNICMYQRQTMQPNSLRGPLWGVDYQFLELFCLYALDRYIRVSVLYSTKSQFRKISSSSTKGMLKLHRYFRLLVKLKMYTFFFAVTQNTKFKAIVYSHSTTSLRVLTLGL
jgi:hypothetical protein